VAAHTLTKLVLKLSVAKGACAEVNAEMAKALLFVTSVLKVGSQR
jgi:hypothetical protein